MKDVGEYFDDVERLVRARSVILEPTEPGKDVFAYDLDAQPSGARGRVLGKIRFPGISYAFLHVDEWVRSEGSHLMRESYAYDLVIRGHRLIGWHRHRGTGTHGADHQHGSDGAHRSARITLREAVDASWELLAGA